MEDKVLSVTLSHPAKTWAIASARIKTDKIDSCMLAHLLRADLIPAAYIPEREVLDLRETLRYRASLVTLRARLKSKFHAILSKNGITCSHSDIFCHKSFAWLASLSLRECYQDAFSGYICLAKVLAVEIKEVEKLIKDLAEKSAEARLLMTMPASPTIPAF